jgi:thiol-disulfide isomerase/thioredoxin
MMAMAHSPRTRRVLGLAACVLLSACNQAGVDHLHPRVQFTTLTGQALGPSQYLGKPLLVNFWASTCPPCLKEMPVLQNAHTRYSGQGLQLVAVAMPYDMPSAAVELQHKEGWTFTVAIDPKSEAVTAFGGVKATPSTFLLNAQGKVVWRFVGELDAATLDKAIRQVLPAAG